MATISVTMVHAAGLTVAAGRRDAGRYRQAHLSIHAVMAMRISVEAMLSGASQDKELCREPSI